VKALIFQVIRREVLLRQLIALAVLVTLPRIF